MPRAPPLGGHPEGGGGAALLGGARGGLSHTQALGSPVAVGQGWSSTGMWGTGCSGTALWGAGPSCQGFLLRASPPSLLCGCWAQPLGLVKQQDRSRLGKRGMGESLNKEFLIWNRLRPVACFLPHPAVLGSAPCPPSARQHPVMGASPLGLSRSCSGTPFWGSGHPCIALGSALHLPLPSLPRELRAVPGLSRDCRPPLRAAARGVQREEER